MMRPIRAAAGKLTAIAKRSAYLLKIAAGDGPLVFELGSGYSGNAIELQDSSGTVLVSIDAGGTIVLPEGAESAPALQIGSAPHGFYERDNNRLGVVTRGNEWWTFSNTTRELTFNGSRGVKFSSGFQISDSPDGLKVRISDDDRAEFGDSGVADEMTAVLYVSDGAGGLTAKRLRLLAAGASPGAGDRAIVVDN